MATFPDSTILQPVLERYPSPYRPSRIDRVGQGGFSGARVWKLTGTGGAAGSFALRQWPRSGLEHERLTGLHRLLRHLFDRGMTQVAVPIAAEDGTTLIEMHNRLWQMEPWMPGTADYHQAPSESKLRAALIALAQWHRAAATFGPKQREKRWFASCMSATSPGISERIERIAAWNSRRLRFAEQKLAEWPWPEFGDVAANILVCFRAKARLVEGELRAASGIRFSLQPCLRDIWHDHVLFSGDEVTGLIDPGACRGETVAGDIARLVGSLVGDNRKAWETAVSAYQEVHPLTLEELGAVELFDRSGVLLSGMTWIDWLVLQSRHVTDRERVLNRIKDILVRLQLLS